MHKTVRFITVVSACLYLHFSLKAQTNMREPRQPRNIIRYNLSGALIFGFDKYVVVGYERLTNKNQSFSINIGLASLPKLISIKTDSVNVLKDLTNTGINISADYRFYLAKENKYAAPRGIYIGPYYSYNSFRRKNELALKQSSAPDRYVNTQTSFSVHSAGVELGYQFIFWKKFAVDLVLIGPGISNYNMHGKFEGTLTEDEHKQLRKVVEQIIKQKFPGMNYVLADKQLNANGILNTWNVGFRYLVHLGFAF